MLSGIHFGVPVLLRGTILSCTLFFLEVNGITCEELKTYPAPGKVYSGDKYFRSWFYFPPIDVMGMAAIHLMKRRADMKDFELLTVMRRDTIFY